MTTKYILAAVGGIFLLVGCMPAARGGLSHPQARTWLLVGVIFCLVSGWLFYQGWTR
jgi:2-keto-3-deoxy-6-phosphogluconate aldolase